MSVPQQMLVEQLQQKKVLAVVLLYIVLVAHVETVHEPACVPQAAEKRRLLTVLITLTIQGCYRILANTSTEKQGGIGQIKLALVTRYIKTKSSNGSKQAAKQHTFIICYTVCVRRVAIISAVDPTLEPAHQFILSI